MRRRVFDWHKAALLIRDRPEAEGSAGLMEDWEMTADVIYRKGTVVPKTYTYTYLASNWATPVLLLDGEDEEVCMVYQDECHDRWGAKTYWPESALKILRGEVNMQEVPELVRQIARHALAEGPEEHHVLIIADALESEGCYEEAVHLRTCRVCQGFRTNVTGKYDSDRIRARVLDALGRGEWDGAFGQNPIVK